METVKFKYKGATYIMSQDQIDAAYEYKRRQFLEADTLSALNRLVFGYDADYLSNPDFSDLLTREEMQDAKYFMEEYEIAYSEAIKLVPAFVMQYQLLDDANVADNDRWEMALKKVLYERTEK